MKKWFVLICALMMSVTCIGVGAAESGYNPGEFVYQTNAEDVKRSGDFHYIILNDGTVEIVKYTGRTAMLKIPSKINGRAVTSIGQNAFWECTFLTEVKISDSVTFIADYAFYGCSGLAYIHIPGNVVSIGSGAFMNCYNAAVLSISPGVTSIGKRAFCDCYSVTEVTLPDTVSFLGVSAFCACESLLSFSFPDSILEIEGNPLEGCPKLTDIQVSADHPTLEIVDGVLFDKLKKQLICYPKALVKKPYTYSIPEGTKDIASYAFASVNLTAIDIPNSVVTIGDYAFQFCFSLTSIIIPEGVTSIGQGTFSCCTRLTSVVIPEGVTSIGRSVFEQCSSLTNVVIPESVGYIADKTFVDSPNITLTVIPGSYAEQYAIDNNIPYIHVDEATPTDASWTCTCGSLNDNNFCPDCGAARPVVEPTCSNCGYDPEGDTPNFCPACGTRF